MCMFTAVAAGLGEMGWNGLALTPEHGARQLFVSLVTDAPFVPNRLYDGKPLCKKCGKCVSSCPTHSISEAEKLSIEIDGKGDWNGEN